MKRFLALSLLSPLFVFVACSDKPDRPPISTNDEGGIVRPDPAGGSNPREGGTTDSGGSLDGGSCNALTNGVAIERLAVPSQLPVPQGGNVTDGTYRITDLAVYTGANGSSGPTGQTFASVISLNAGRIEQIARSNSSGDSRTAGSYTVTSPNLTVTLSCPQAGAPTTVGYTATAGQLSLIFTATNEVATYIKL